ncbi:TonB family protein [Azospira inquinata]|uniref:TonB family protein n=1 Tax=Azospira inquinata TaxID=2785627 RepID=A0A975XTZ4_9RHOO|nr:TonB family protein [Azospira inquinata]QWT46434.1 TonB family protein [Azospira inquinata]QWT48242.1 TonB family protein [Azospira inquinata]
MPPFSPNSRLILALGLSLLLHGLVVTPPWRGMGRASPDRGMPRLEARLRMPPPPPPRATLPAKPVPKSLPPAPPPRPKASPVVHKAPAETKETAPHSPPAQAPAPVPKLQAPAKPRVVMKAPNPVLRAAQAQLAEYLPYPPAAVAQGLEGETLVRVFLDAQGNALAARVERSSGAALLDDAAVAAARRLKALPQDAPDELLLPVRFRLH